MSLVSVCVPCYNAERFVEEALRSVQQQTVPPWELVVVDDGSTDGSAERVQQSCPEARYFLQNHRGIGAALNRAASEARGDWLAWIDADDIWLPSKLEVQLRACAEHPTWDGCFVQLEHFREDGAAHEMQPGRHRGALLIRRTAFDRVGAFREDVGVGEFVDWCSRAQQLGLQLGQVARVLYRRRIHGANTVLRSGSGRDYLKILRLAVERRRQDALPSADIGTGGTA